MAIELLTPFTKGRVRARDQRQETQTSWYFGWKFQPVHNAHLVVADQVRQQLG